MKKIVFSPLLKLLSLLPLPVLRSLGSFLGVIALKVFKRTNLRLRENLLATGMCNLANVNSMARRTAQESGKTLIEILSIVWHRSKNYNSQFVLHAINFSQVEQVASRNGPMIFLTPHMSNFELPLKYTANRIKRKFTVLYKPSKDAWLEQLMFKGRSADNITPVPTSRQGVLALMKALKQNEIIGILPDSVASHGDGVWVEFFGKRVFATTLAAKMIAMSKAPTFIVASTRIKHGFSVEYIPYVPSSYVISSMVQEIYAILEQIVLRSPTQYYWSYDRFRVPKHAQPILTKDN